jgi:hypothetical protein
MNSHFLSLIVGLAQQAEQILDGRSPAGTNQDPRQAARLLIDTLAMLEQKTAGHLEPDELKLLSDMLTALRFRFVQTEKR